MKKPGMDMAPPAQIECSPPGRQGSRPGLMSLFDGICRQHATRVALRQAGTSWSYETLSRRSREVANALLQTPRRSEELVGLYAGRTPETIATLLGILRAGCAYVPLDATLPDDRLAFMISDAGLTTVLVADSAGAERLGRLVPTGVELRWLEDCHRAAAPDPQPTCAQYPDASQLAYTIYTSGSTGRPKGVMVEQASVIAMATNAALVAAHPDDVFLQLTPLSADPSVFEIWTPLLAGACLALPPPGELSVSDIVKVVQEERVSVLRLVAPLFNLVMEGDLSGLRSLRAVISGGDRASVPAVQRALRELPDCVVINGYGPTETTVYACCHTMRAYDQRWRSVPIGRPLESTFAVVLDAAGQPVPAGAEGELYIGGEGVARGYLNRPELTHERFLTDARWPGCRLYRTGDFVRWLPDGNLEFCGRNDQQIKVRGFRVELGEVEAALRALPGVGEAIVVGEQAARGATLVAFVMGASDAAAPDAAELRLGLARALPDYMLPSSITLLSSWPRLPNGKIDRQALRGRRDVQPASMGAAAASVLEQQLLGIWRSCFAAPQLGVEDDFFGAGGDSLTAMAVVAAIEREQGTRIPMSLILERRTVRLVAAWLSTANRDAAPTRDSALTAVSPRVSPGQEALWLEDQQSSGSQNAIDVTYRLTGNLDGRALSDAVLSVSRRHELLTSAIRLDAGGVLRLVPGVCGPELTTVDLRDRPEAVRESEAQELIERERSRTFVLSEGPLLRLLALRLADCAWILHVRVHHIIADDWSIHVLQRDLSKAYREHSALQPLSHQFAQHAALEWSDAQSAAPAIADWRVELAGFEGPLMLPLDHVRPPVFGGRAERCSRTLEPELARAASALARDQHVSRFHLALAAVYLLLSAYSRQNDICIGTPIARRSRPGDDELIGYCINFVPLRIRADADLSVSALLAQVRDLSVAAFRRQDVPFPALLHALGLARDPARFPLFQAALTYQTLSPNGFELSGTKLTAGPIFHSSSAKFDIGFGFREEHGRIFVDVEYCTSLFERASIDAMADHLVALYQWLTESPTLAIGDARMWSDDEHARVCVTWNATERAIPELPLHQLVLDQLERRKDHSAVELHGEVTTYGMLGAASRRIAARLANLGVGAGDRVALCLDRSPRLLAAMLGVLQTGAAYVPLDAAYPAERLQYVLSDARPRVLVTTESLQQSCFGSVDAACSVRDIEQLLLDAPDPVWAPPQVSPDSAAYIIYTSGSTGRPKGVVIDHRSVVARLSAYAGDFAFRPGDVWSQFASAGFDMAVFEQFMPLITGATSIICPDEIRENPTAFVEFVNERRITVLILAPSFLQALNRPAFPTVRFLCTGGEPANMADVMHYAREKFYLNGYGPTEVTICATTYLATGKETGARLPLGKPLPNTKLWVVDPRGRPLPIGVPGELHVAGIGVAREYWSNPDLTSAKFVSAPWTEGARTYKTGDLVRWLPDGTLDFLGRIDQQVKIRGHRIELGEIEAVLATFPGVLEAKVLVHRDTVPVAFIVCRPGYSVRLGDLREHARTQLPRYMVPAGIRQLPALPLNEHHKLDRRALERMAAETDWSASTAAPRGRLEEALAQIWQDCLGVSRIGTDDDFFALGGHSFLIVRMLNRVETELGCRVPIRDFLQNSTLQGLAQLAQSPAQESHAHPAVDCTTELEEVGRLHFVPAGADRDMRNVLLTGASGFLGSALLVRLLSDTQARVFCLSRARTAVAARARLGELMSAYGPDIPDLDERVVPVLGDLSLPGLGLTDQVRASLVDQLDTLFHLGAHVHHFSPYERLRAANVGATLELLRLAASGRAKRLHHASSLAVFASEPLARRISEREPLDHERHSRGRGYAASKWVADRIVGAARLRGAECSIYRIGRLASDSVSGTANPDDMFCRILLSCVALRAYPAGESLQTNLVPVDLAAQAILALAHGPAGTFHLHDSLDTSVEPFMRVLAQHFGLSCEPIDLAAWVTRLRQRADGGDELPVFPYLHVLEDLAAHGHASHAEYDNTETRRQLDALGVPLPALQEEWIIRYWSYMDRIGALGRALEETAA